MRLTLAALTVSIAAGFAAPVTAAGTLFDCTVKQTSGPRGWVSPRIAVVLEDTGRARIIDSITLQFETGPRPANVRRSGDTVKLNWSFSGLTDSSSQMIPSLSYSANLNTKTGAFKVRGKPARFPQTVRGRGKCEARGNLTPKQLKSLLRG